MATWMDVRLYFSTSVQELQGVLGRHLTDHGDLLLINDLEVSSGLNMSIMTRVLPAFRQAMTAMTRRRVVQRDVQEEPMVSGEAGAGDLAVGIGDQIRWVKTEALGTPVVPDV
jgi:hypothetical protein